VVLEASMPGPIGTSDFITYHIIQEESIIEEEFFLTLQFGQR
jgi:hypothetical protein